MFATHYLKATMLVPAAQMDVVDAAAFALASVRAQRLDDGEFMACWDLGELAHELEEEGLFRVPLFAQLETPGLEGIDQLKLTARSPDDLCLDAESKEDWVDHDGRSYYVSVNRDETAQQCRFEDISLIDLNAKKANAP